MLKLAPPLSALALLALFFALASASPATQPATRLEEKLTVAGVARTYILRVPAKLDPAQSVPLLLLLHGSGDDAPFAEQAYGFAQLGAQHNFIVAYPEGLGAARRKSWHGLDFDQPNADVDFLQALLAKIRRDYPIDPARIFVAGHSSGAIMAYRLASECPDQIAAAGIVAGTVGRYNDYGKVLGIARPRQPVSIIAFHGQADPSIPYENLTHDPGTDAAVAYSLRFWVRADACDLVPVRTTSHHANILRDDWTNGKAGTAVTLVTIADGNHMWPGSTVGPDKPRPNADINASDLMWQFFTTHPKQPPATQPAK